MLLYIQEIIHTYICICKTPSQDSCKIVHYNIICSTFIPFIEIKLKVNAFSVKEVKWHSHERVSLVLASYN